MKYYSRLDRKNERRAYWLMAFGVVVLIIFVIYGFPAILNLTSIVSSYKHSTPTVTTDKGLPPTTPRFSQTLTATKSATINISGVADSKISVEIFQNGISQGTTTAMDDGSFKMSVDLNRGANSFTAVATSDTGQKSEVSDPYDISYLNKEPNLDISSPKDGDNISDTSTNVTGTTDSGAQVTVNDRFAIVRNDGSFSYTLNLNNGDNKIKVVATDQAGNQTTKELTVKSNH